jgi:hypothetical protein
MFDRRHSTRSALGRFNLPRKRRICNIRARPRAGPGVIINSIRRCQDVRIPVFEGRWFANIDRSPLRGLCLVCIRFYTRAAPTGLRKTKANRISGSPIRGNLFIGTSKQMDKAP